MFQPFAMTQTGCRVSFPGDFPNRVVLLAAITATVIALQAATAEELAIDLKLVAKPSQPKHELSESDLETDINLGLIAYYPFDGGPHENSGLFGPLNVEHAVLTTDRFGNENSAYEFDGLKSAMWMNVESFPHYQGRQSLAWWFFTETLQTYAEENGAGNMIILVDADGGHGIQCGFRAPGYNTLGLDVWKWGGGTLLEVKPPAVSSWHHCAYTFDGATHRFYLGGKENSSSQVAPQKGSPAQLMLGNYPGGDQFFRGKLDDIRIYDRVLNRREIELLFQEKR